MKEKKEQIGRNTKESKTEEENYNEKVKDERIRQ
jgi:hypothetical protein